MLGELHSGIDTNCSYASRDKVHLHAIKRMRLISAIFKNSSSVLVRNFMIHRIRDGREWEAGGTKC